MKKRFCRVTIVLLALLFALFGVRLYVANEPATATAVTEVKGSFSMVRIPTPIGYVAVSKVDPLLNELWDTNLPGPEKLSVYASLKDSISIRQGTHLATIHDAFVASNPNFGNGFYNHKDFEQYKDTVREMVKKATKDGLGSVEELARAQQQLTNPITDITMVLSSFASERILLFLMVGTDGDSADKTAQPERFAKACSFVNVRGNLICCYMFGKPTELVKLEADCFKWSEEIVRENPSTISECLREASPFNSALTH
jgi:hypothetical protein